MSQSSTKVGDCSFPVAGLTYSVEQPSKPCEERVVSGDIEIPAENPSYNSMLYDYH